MIGVWREREHQPWAERGPGGALSQTDSGVTVKSRVTPTSGNDGICLHWFRRLKNCFIKIIPHYINTILSLD